MAISKNLRIGTRGSLLALAQANEVKKTLQFAYPFLLDEGKIDIVKIKTTGDLNQDKALHELGGKGMFSKEIDRAMLDGDIDIAVHSLKDVETMLCDGILLAAVLKREDPRDVMLSRCVSFLSELPKGSIVGTSSLRRQAQILNLYPYLKCTLFRGNIQTRMKKLENNEVDATFLALAGLNRLGMAEHATEIFEPDIILPAVCQGTIGITCRVNDLNVKNILSLINHKKTMISVKCERSLLASLDGTCKTPIGGLAVIQDDGSLFLRGMIAQEDGSQVFKTSRKGDVEDAEQIGFDAGFELRKLAGPNMFL